MKQKEKELLKNLCAFKQKEFHEYLLTEAGASVLGHLFLNRMQGVAYGVLEKHELLSKVPREFRTALSCAYEQNCVKNKSFIYCLEYLKHLLEEISCPYAMLKGAVLCQSYPSGYRTSNDIDLLVSPEDVTAVGERLLSDGFIQGHLHNNEIVPATRKEIIESKMLRGETVPYIKKVDLPNLQYLEIDINFSLDYKNSETFVLKQMLKNCCDRKDLSVPVQTLSEEDFFIYLCGHLYKEATTMPWIKMKRDMTLYKYCDIYFLISEMSEPQLMSVFERAAFLKMEKIVSFAILQTMDLFQMNHPMAHQMAKAALKKDPHFLHTVISPKEKKQFIYKQKNVIARFFSNDRMALLKEVKNDAKTEYENQ